MRRRTKGSERRGAAPVREGPGDRSPNPLLTVRLWGLADRRLDVALTLALLAMLALSRLAAFPASIWDQDEAYFSTAVVHFDPLANHPHPPWFPLWILLGKLLAPLVRDPALGLRMLSSLSSVWIVFPLTTLWSRLLRRDLAVVAATLYCMLPGVWLLSGRAFTEPAATALLALTAAAWFAWEHASSSVTGSLAAGACVLVRPHFVIAVLPLLVLALARRHDRRTAAALAAPAAIVVAAGFAWVVAAAGGLEPLAAALRTHAAIHFGELSGFTPSFAGLGLSRALVAPAAAVVWLVLAAVGSTAGWRAAHPATVAVLVVEVFLGALVLGASNPEHTRYWLPLLAFSSGLVVRGLTRLVRRWTSAAVTAAVVGSAIVVLPALPTYRSQPSPPVAATRFAFTRARVSGSVVVVDRTLVAFVDRERALRPFPGTVILDSQVELGETVPPPSFATVYLWSERRPSLVAHAEATRRFSCTIPLLRRVEQARFLDLAVASGAQLRRASPVPTP